MKLPKCKAYNGHYFNKHNICTRCGFDYNEVIKAEADFKEEIKNKPELKGMELIKEAEKRLK